MNTWSGIRASITPNILRENIFYSTPAVFVDLFAENRHGYSRKRNAPIVSADRFRVVVTGAM
ncbi:hypothetical protein [Nocardia alni]|uniref:hypothetical protein n=1 Tax=Nocardia alni TaxID=2815723 RepID=UPI001C213BD3|nr:hypothetical protein [Nocardia alni]